MEGRALLRCVDCGRTHEICGEMPEEYGHAFVAAVDEGWIVKPGAIPHLICGPCLQTYVGSETKDDEENF